MKTFIVLGMHRSATSLVAQGLLKAGVYMGERLLGAHESNPHGHYEDIDFIHLNDTILKTAGGSWNNPPYENAIIEAGKELEDKIKAIIKLKSIHSLWGWKDPRTTLTIRCYLPYLKNVHFMACYREPLDVAKSLNKRDNTGVMVGIALVKIYNDRMNKFLQEFTG